MLSIHFFCLGIMDKVIIHSTDTLHILGNSIISVSEGLPGSCMNNGLLSFFLLLLFIAVVFLFLRQKL